MGTRKIVYVVFLLPVIVSIIFASIVLVEALKQPHRELKILQPNSPDSNIGSSDAIKIIGIQKQYLVITPIEIQIRIDDQTFNCGDLYITIFDITFFEKKVVSQSGFFNQCFNTEDSLLPVDDEFSEIITDPGNYEIEVKMTDEHQKKTISQSAKFSVK